MKNMEILERLQHWLNCRSIPQVDVIARGTAEFLEDVKSVLNSFDCYDFEETPNSVEDTCIFYENAEDAEDMVDSLLNIKTGPFDYLKIVKC